MSAQPEEPETTVEHLEDRLDLLVRQIQAVGEIITTTKVPQVSEPLLAEAHDDIKEFREETKETLAGYAQVFERIETTLAVHGELLRRLDAELDAHGRHPQ